jgi:hypothetical protein
MAAIKKKKTKMRAPVSRLLVLASIIVGTAFIHHIYGSDVLSSTSFLEQTGTSTSSLRPAEVSTASSERLTSTVADWPGIPVEELGHPLVKNLCGIRINHAYALFLSVKFFQPTTIIESGVNAGQSTYFMRAASPTARIYAIDPLDKPICGQEKRWIDEKNAVYYTGDNFQDIGDIDWGSKIRAGEVDPDKTLVGLALCIMLP